MEKYSNVLIRAVVQLLLFCIFISCNKRDGNDQIEQLPQWTIVPSGKKSFPLDSASGFASFSIQIFSESGIKYLAINNHLNKTINVYDFLLGTLAYKIKLKSEGPNSVGSTPLAAQIVNRDSIFILSHWESQISLVDSSGRLYYKKILVKDIWKEPIPWASTDIPMSLSNDKANLKIPVVLRSPENGYSGSFARMNLDLEKDTFKYDAPYPKIYDEGFWVHDIMLRGFSTIDFTNGGEVFGFSIDPYITHTSGQRYLAKSSYINKMKPAYDEYIDHFDPEAALKACFLSGAYSSLISNPWDRAYYRLAFHPLRELQWDNGERDLETSIILLDEKFNNRGEVNLENGIQPWMFFIDEEGIYFADKKSYDEDEDTLTFIKYSLVKETKVISYER